MAKRNILAVVLGFMIFLINTIPAMAWTTGSTVSSSSGVEISVNNMGQTVYRVYSGGYLQLEIFAKNGNIWNNTMQVLLANGTNKGAAYVGIDHNYNVYGVTSQVVNGKSYSEVGTRYSRYFANGSQPEYLVEYPGVTGFATDSTGFVTGIYTSRGLYSISQNSIISDNTTYDNNDAYSTEYPVGYPYVVQNGNDYYYYTSSNYQYTYTLSSKRLKYGNTTIASNVDEVAWGYGCVLYVTTSNQVYASQIGSTRTTKICSNFLSWTYDSNNLVIAVRDTNSQVYSLSSYGYSSSYSYCDDNNYYDYPYVWQDGIYYYYEKDSNTTYTYRLTTARNLYYNSTFIASNVDEIQFGDGYLLYVIGNTAYSVKIGNRSYYKKYNYFQEFIYDGEWVIGIRTSTNTYYL